nr:DapH/DapD/GlmU-related protein [Arthrobacter crystallopoietes]
MLWYKSSLLHRAGRKRTARCLKIINYVIFRAILPPEVELSGPVSLGHFGLNVVVHPNCTIGREVHIWHGVTIAVSDSPGADSRVYIGDNVVIGTNSVVITREKEGLTISNDVRIGAGSVVTRSITAPGSYAGSPAKAINRI